VADLVRASRAIARLAAAWCNRPKEG
jgi:hypothetical protein